MNENGAWCMIICHDVTNTKAGLMHDVTVVSWWGRDWLQLPCLVNIDDCTKHVGNIFFYFIVRLFYFIVRSFYLNGSEFVKINDERGLFSYLIPC